MNAGTLFTVRNSLFAITAVLMLGMVVMPGISAMDAMDARDAEHEVGAANVISDNLLTSANNWAVERGVTNANLAGDNPVSKKALDGLKDFRDFAGKKDLIKAAWDAYKKAISMRKVADQQLAKAKIDRNPAGTKTWVPTMTGLILKSQKLRTATSNSVETSAVVGQLITLKHFAWMMSEFAGRDRAVMGGIIAAGSPLPRAKRSALAGYRGRVESARDSLKTLIQAPGTSDVVIKAVAGANSGYFGSFEKFRQSVYAASLGTSAYTLNVSEWIGKSTKAIDALLAVQSAAGKAANNNLEIELAHVTKSFVTGLAILIAAVVIGAVAFWIVGIRVLRPINAMTATMTTMAEGSLEVDVPAQDRKDEVGEMARAVEVFKENGLEQRRLEAEAVEQRKESEVEKERQQAADTKREREREAAEAEAAQKRKAEADRKELMAKMADDFESSVGKVVQTVSSASTEMESSAQSMASTAEQTNTQSTAVAAAAEQASTNVQTVATAAEELSASINEISRQVAQSSEIAGNAVIEAKRTDEQV